MYIGQSKDVFVRISNHKSRLNNNKHYNEHLQRAWNKYGEKSFSFEVIEHCAFDNLFQRENKWVLHYKSHDEVNGYNKTIPNEDSTALTHTKEVRKQISEKTTKYSDEELISYLQEFFYMEGRLPTQKELDSPSSSYPSTCISRFGNTKNAFIRADLYWVANKNRLEEITKESVLESLMVFIENHHYFPEAREMTTENNLYSYSTIKKLFENGIESVKAVFGYDKETVKHLEQLEALACLKEIYNENGFVSDTLIDGSNKCKGRSYFQRSFGSFTNAYIMVGIDPEKNLKDSLAHYNSLRKQTQ